MKSFSSFLLTAILCIGMHTIFAHHYTFEPENPMPGEEVTITYHPEGTVLEGQSFEATAFLFDGDMPFAQEVEMTEKDGVYTGVISTREVTRVLFVKFANAELEKVDTNDELGMGIMLYESDRKTPVAGAYGHYANAVGVGFNRFIGIKGDPAMALEYYEKEFKAHPETQADFMVNYTSTARATKDEDALAKVDAYIQTTLDKKKATEDEYATAGTMARILRKQDLFESIQAQTIKKYKKGRAAGEKMASSFYAAKTTAEKEAVFNKFNKSFGKLESSKNQLGFMAGNLASAYAKAEQWDKFDTYFSMMNNPLQQASTLNSIAWASSGESIEGEGKNMEKGAELSKMSLELVEKGMKDPKEKPNFYTDKQWKQSQKRAYGMYADTYALLKYKLGDAKTALEYQQIATEANKFRDGTMNTRYAIFYEEIKGAKATEKLLEKFIKKGNATAKMKDQYKRLFLANHTVESAFEKYMASLESKANEKRKMELAKKMISEDAPTFTLKNLDGEAVSLAELKGKVVVIDFWATWCGPCKASFPGMQKAVTKYEADENVVFLFVDTWESAKDKEKNAGDFITKNEYTFEVLMDNDNKVVESFGVSGIPTKFIIGTDGKIKFKSVGFSGNNDELAEELSMMIEMAGDTDEMSFSSTR